MKITNKGMSSEVTFDEAMRRTLHAVSDEQGVFEDIQEELENVQKFLMNLTAVLIEKDVLTAKDLKRLLRKGAYDVS